ncbi:hypothetical protein [Leptolyngbya sp. 7M]|uniref:hypothetical protein n=1 Tax=Leptolyngbya sp. 7M TaxID=2812896 RepID=UPI001B8AE15D|nr:hypothetical protein [Leptolyngbya sp. 7M]QYO64382.1 hypothetical protein JVX88_32615 [Leptolyngbya sp. 7M]
MLGQRVHQFEQGGDLAERGLDEAGALPQPLDRPFGKLARLVAGIGNLALVEFERLDRAAQGDVLRPQALRRTDDLLHDPRDIGATDRDFTTARGNPADRAASRGPDMLVLHDQCAP